VALGSSHLPPSADQAKWRILVIDIVAFPTCRSTRRIHSFAGGTTVLVGRFYG
jgi:hypothetical protein